MKKHLAALILIMILLFTVGSSTALAASKPSKPSISSAVAASETSIKLRWKKVKDADGYVIYQKKNDGKYKLVKTITKGSTTSYTKKNLTSGAKYTYKLRAYKKSGKKNVYSSYSKSQTCYALYKTKISSLSATANSITIKWKKVKGASGYAIYQKKENGKYKLIKTITKGSTTSYTKKDLSEATKYSYKIKAYKKSGGKKIYGNYSSVNTRYTLKNNFKTKITSLTPTIDSVKIKWKKVKGADGYVIYQKQNNGKYKLVKTITKGSTTSYTKKKLSGDTKYSYKIKAYQKAGDYKIYGSYSAVKSTRTLIPHTYTVTFDVGNSDVNTIPAIQYITEGKTAAQPAAPIRQGYIFDGWYTDENCLNKYDFKAKVTCDIVLYAKWKPVPADMIILTSSTDSVLIGNNDRIYFYASTGIVAKSLNLYAGNKIVAYMYDDGNFSSHGDDIAGDGIYSACVSPTVSNDATVTFKATNGEKVSNTVNVNYYTKISSSTVASINTVINTTNKILSNAAFDSMTEKEKKNIIQQTLSSLEASNDIVKGTINYNEKAKLYSFQYAEGILGGISLENFDSEKNGNSTTVATQKATAVSSASNSTAVSDDIGTAIILNSFPSFETEQEYISYRTTFYENVKADWDEKGLKTTLDTNVTVSDYMNIDDYNVICISTHGSVYSWRDGLLWTDYHEVPAFCLSETAKSKSDKYSKELKDHQLAIVNGHYWILPDFFTDNFTDNAFENSFVFAECCQSFGKGLKYDYTMANAFINKSAKDYIGFHNSVFATYSRNFMKTYIDQLIEGETTLKAYQKATSSHGANHEIWFNKTHSYSLKDYTEKYQEKPQTYKPSFDIAYSNRRGYNDKATLLLVGIKNGNFDSYNTVSSAPKFWDTEGDVRTLLKLGNVVSANQRMAVVTTGVGAQKTATLGTGTEGSIIKQTFIVPNNVTTLSFDYNFVSEEPMEYVGTKYNDAYGVQLIQNGNVVYQSTYESINSSTWFTTSGIDFSGGDQTVYQTGWKTAQINVSGYRGKVITLCFVIYDVGDSIYDSACVIDNVRLK